MRRVLSAVAMTLGVALLLIGIFGRSWLYDKLATVPLNQQTTSVSEGQNMSALRIWGEPTTDAEGKPTTKAHYDKLTGVTLRSTRNVEGIPGKVTEPGTAVWQTTVLSEAVGVAPLTYSNEIVTFNRVTGEATGSPVDKRSAGDLDDDAKMVDIKHEGQYFKFPFNTQQQTYKFWDGDLSKAVDISFVRQEDLFGTNTYVFEQVIPQTEITTRDLPAGIFDATGDDVNAKVMYGNTRTLWVEPNTGVIIKGQEVLDKSLVSDKGTVATTKGTIGYNEATVKDNAEVWGKKGSLLGFVRDTLRPVGIIAGLLLIGLGLALLAKRGRGSDADDANDDAGTRASRANRAARPRRGEEASDGVESLMPSRGSGAEGSAGAATATLPKSDPATPGPYTKDLKDSSES